MLESLAIWAFFFVAYSLFGYYVTVKLEAIPFDATARLAHAYFVWHNDPPKLAAVGFVWPPLPTLLYMPFTLWKWMGSSLLALPLSTAFFTGLLMATINGMFTLVNIPWHWRYAMLLAFACNPFIVHYAVNGMAEMIYLWLLTLSVYHFIRWHLGGEVHYLALSGLSMSLALLSRYEIAAYALVMFAFLLVLLVMRHASRSQGEAAVLLYVAPIVYATMMWLFFNWLIVGDALYFLDEQVRQRFEETPQEAVSGPAALVALTAKLHFRLFAPTLLVLVPLVVIGLAKRSVMSLMLAGLIALNPVTTAFLIVQATQVSLLQPRFNMRGMPLVLIGVAWLFYLLRDQLARLALLGGTVLALVFSYPLTWDLMKNFEYQFAEGFFTGALETGRPQNPAEVGVRFADDMAKYINANITQRDSILTDDAQSFLPMLMSGRPELFLDRIDKGDRRWLRIRDRPIGRVRYMLMAAPEASVDLLLLRYPEAPKGGVPFLRREHTSGKFILFRVVRPPPSAQTLARELSARERATAERATPPLGR